MLEATAMLGAGIVLVLEATAMLGDGIVVTSRLCSRQPRSGLLCGAACVSHSLMLPSPDAEARMFSLASLQAQSHRPSTVSNAATGCRPCDVICAATQNHH